MILFHQMKLTSNSSIGLKSKEHVTTNRSVSNLTKLASKLGVALKKAWIDHVLPLLQGLFRNPK